MRYPDGDGLTAQQRAQRERERVRLEAAEMFAHGLAPPQVAKRLRVSRKSAYAWHARWRDGGTQALRSTGPSGRPSRMRPEWRPGWRRSWSGGRPRTAGLKDQRWMLGRVATVIARRFHIHFSPAQIWRILHQMGWSVQAPIRRAAERNEDAVATWIKETWPQVERR